MTDFVRLPIRQTGSAKRTDAFTSDMRYWSKYRKPTLHKESSFINNLHFAESSPHLLAVTVGSKVQIYHPSTHDVAKTITRFSDLAYSGHLRADGKLLVAGDEAGGVSVFEMGTRSILRSFGGHAGPVHLTRFSPNKTQVLSGSDDKTVRVWDIPSNSVVTCFEQHTDYVRAGTISTSNPNLLLTGSYDHTVRLWDLRTNTSVMTMSHDSPCESVLFFPGSTAVVSSGGPYFKVFDLVAGGRSLHHVSNHQKTITAMTFDHSGSRLLTGSLDHSVKIYNVANFKVVHTLKYQSPILSLAVSPNDTHMAVGMVDGTLSLRSRDEDKEGEFEVGSERGVAASYRTGSYRYFMRGQGYQPSATDFQVMKAKKPKLNAYDVYLKKFEYANALDVVFETNQPPIVIVSLIEELLDRNGLDRALQGRTEESLGPLLQFLMRNITHPYFSPTLATVTHTLLDIYTPVLARSEVLQSQLKKITEKLAEERRVVTDLTRLVGALDMVMANSAKTSELRVSWHDSQEELERRLRAGLEEQGFREAEERMRAKGGEEKVDDGEAAGAVPNVDGVNGDAHAEEEGDVTITAGALELDLDLATVATAVSPSAGLDGLDEDGDAVMEEAAVIDAVAEPDAGEEEAAVETAVAAPAPAKPFPSSKAPGRQGKKSGGKGKGAKRSGRK
ncbi:WD40-repeat-containing domain protein [Catenaria anguillulae PL171]|uniref:WD40-repeat-containing domain protein n=1 Tax=Catenaria anguillulae PL171 TaxID=765915 RepID=A0A1Y2I2I7_9FUNG|nr:WD40-repeat-containing domain protein [Catenaria anguillulae PL171]